MQSTKRKTIRLKRRAVVRNPDLLQACSLKFMRDLPRVNKTYWFEYHCHEAHDSADAHLWYRSHQKVRVISIELEDGYGTTQRFRSENGTMCSATIQFSDGFIGGCFEDELLTSKSQFEREDPPTVDEKDKTR